MPDARPRDRADSEANAEELSGDALDIDGLKARGDIAGLLELARAYRSGTATGGRDMQRCFDTYRAAADLGSAEAEYAVALFWMSGGVVAQDLKEGAMRLRAAAEKGSVPAKVYVGNLYELGIHYKADTEKADVWYKSAARGAQITSEPGSDRHTRELAEIGCVRFVLALVESGSVDDDDKTRLLQRARAHGYGLRLKDDMATGRPEIVDSLRNTDDRAAADVASTADDPTKANKRARPIEEKDTEAKPASKPSGPSRAPIAIGAFGYAMLFAVAGASAGYAAMLGARELVAHGTPLPGLGTRTHLVFPIVLGVVGVLPTWLVYRLGTVIKALLVGAFFGGIGWVAWGTGQAALHSVRSVQAIAFGLAGFLAALFVLGLLGGTKRTSPRRRHPTG
jgi:hypothetical protein